MTMNNVVKLSTCSAVVGFGIGKSYNYVKNKVDMFVVQKIMPESCPEVIKSGTSHLLTIGALASSAGFIISYLPSFIKESGQQVSSSVVNPGIARRNSEVIKAECQQLATKLSPILIKLSTLSTDGMQEVSKILGGHTSITLSGGEGWLSSSPPTNLVIDAVIDSLPLLGQEIH